MMKLMQERSSINVVNDQTGSPTYAADLARAILQIIEKTGDNRSAVNHFGGIYHFSNEGAISWYDFAVAIKELTGSQCTVHPIPTSQYPTPAKRPAWSVLDKAKIREVFGVHLSDWKRSLAVCISRIGSSSEL